MNPIDNILHKLEYCIQNGTYEKIETDRYELKDNSHNSSDWKEVYKTANAFLNTKGGIIFIGIHEDEIGKKYTFTGFDHRNEEKIKEVSKQFTDAKGEKLNNPELYFPIYEIKEFLTGHLLLIYIDPLPDDEKYVYLNGKAYERQLTGDHIISQSKINAHAEYKQQIRDARELMPVINATVGDLDIDKLNHYIFLLNRIKKTEAQKSNIEDAISFLNRKKMIRDGQPTILGMLTCGKNPEDFLFNKCQIDCYVDHPLREVVARSKKVFADTVITLMEEGERFVVQNIETGVSIEKGGTALYEYPLELIRESINNSLAHRDYAIDRFVTIKVIPKKQIEIRNPGRFNQLLLIEDMDHKMPVRRIIPGDSQANNPRLAGVLKVFDKWEGQGIGMATLTGACLQNEIDLPYYVLHSKDELSLVIPSGKLLDRQIEGLFETYSGYLSAKLKGSILTDDQKRVLTYLYKSEISNKLFRYTILLTKDNNHLDAIRSLLESELIFRHDKSDNINPVYLLDRQLFQSDFKEMLKGMFGSIFSSLKPEYIDVLNIIYEANNFSQEKYLSANQIGNLLWLRSGNENIIEGFEDYKRKIRYIVSRLETGEYIIRIGTSPQYVINENFNKGLFS